MKYSQSEKMEIISMVEGSNLSVKKTLEHIGVSRSSFYEWYRKYLDYGIDGLQNNYRTPGIFWNAIPPVQKDKTLKIAREYPEKSSREIACFITDNNGFFISESSVYRILRDNDLISSPVYTVLSAADKFQHPTSRINELWQTDFTYFKIVNWGWYYLSTVLDDFSRYILAWKLCKSMKALDVKDTLDIAIEKTGVQNVKVIHRPKLLSDNGPCYISSELKDYLSENKMGHTRGRPYHPMTQGKIERYHRSMKNIILLDKYYSTEELSRQIERWVNYYNNERYHEAIGNVTPKSKYLGVAEKIIKRRKKVKDKSMKIRRAFYNKQKKTLAH